MATPRTPNDVVAHLPFMGPYGALQATIHDARNRNFNLEQNGFQLVSTTRY
eukprot:m.11668 g.11668  ORF g.11668 m.11668 type:complete len:51 (+) comp8915_c0_seq1:57-209(+)